MAIFMYIPMWMYVYICRCEVDNVFEAVNITCMQRLLLVAGAYSTDLNSLHAVKENHNNSSNK